MIYLAQPWATIGGGSRVVTVTTCYYPCEALDATSGLRAVWGQWKNYLKEAIMRSGEHQQDVKTMDLRDKLIKDLDEFIARAQRGGHRIILLGNMNQDMYSLQRRKGVFAILCERRILYTALHNHEGDLLLSQKQGRNIIDHIVLGNIAATNMREAGQLQFGVGYSTSDHYAIYADINM